MGVGEDFSTFCNALRTPLAERNTLAGRCAAITKRLNTDFRSSSSDSANRFYVGSYGRGTAIRGLSDVDLLYEMPASIYHQYDAYTGNGQSALLQTVRNSILKTYSSTSVGGDGQVVVVSFSDGTRFEVLPAFLNQSDTYTFADSNNGGSWKTTNPKAEIKAISERNSACNGNLKELCHMARAWRDQCNAPLSGLLIDTLAYNFIANWIYRDRSYLYYDYMSRDFFYYLSLLDGNQQYWLAPGSHQYVWTKGNFTHKAKSAYNIALGAIDAQEKGYTWTARTKWREIYGTNYPIA
ncbi:SMODS domain-containing nucleotidyltransferase [Azospirillum argentinense]